MLRRLTGLIPLRVSHLIILEAGLVGWLFISALRYLTGMLYSRTASAALVTGTPADLLNNSLPGVVDPALVSTEIALAGGVIALPLITLLLGRIRFLFVVAVAMIAGGRVLMVLPESPLSATTATELAVAGGLLYIALLIYNRARSFPYFFVFGFSIDQIVRAYGNTLDPTWTPATAPFQTIIFVTGGVLLLLSLITALPDHSKQNRAHTSATDNERGILTLWGGIGLGALLFLQMNLLATPNAIAGRADTDYTLFVPFVLVATLLPIIPAVRQRVRNFLGPFDSNTRGWIWLIALALLLVIGTRIQTISLPGIGNFPAGGVALVLAQATASLTWWWFAPPQGERRRNFTGLWLIPGTLIFILLIIGDTFTYEYAFVSDFMPPFDSLNSVIPPLLRGFRGMGLAILLIAAFLAVTPVIQFTGMLPWRGGTALQTLLTSALVVIGASVAGFFVQPPVIQPVLNVNELRVGTYNIHAGYSEFYDYNLEAIARTIEGSGAAVVLLQEVEAGRMTSFSVDQSLWLARRLGMDRRFYATTEGIQGLTVLSRVPIVFDDGIPLSGVDRDTGLQRVQIRPDEGAVTLYNTMLGFLLAGDNIEEQERNQQQQLDAIIGAIKQHIENDYGGQLGRAILGGTFHNVPDSPLIQELARTGFSDPFAGANPELAYTLERTGNRGRVDYIWLWEQNLRSTGINVIDSLASDHRMAVVGVLIRQE